MIEAILLAVTIFLFFLGAQFFYFHYRRPQNRWRAVSYFSYIFFVIYIVVYWLMPVSNWFGIFNDANVWSRSVAFVNGAVIYIFLFLSYGQFYFLIDRGVSARILVEIIESSSGALSREAIAAQYSPDAMQKRRLDDMLYGGYVSVNDGIYRCTAKGKILGMIFRWCKRYLHLYPGG
jgi:hypothetical protein